MTLMNPCLQNNFIRSSYFIILPDESITPPRLFVLGTELQTVSCSMWSTTSYVSFSSEKGTQYKHTNSLNKHRDLYDHHKGLNASMRIYTTLSIGKVAQSNVSTCPHVSHYSTSTLPCPQNFT